MVKISTKIRNFAIIAHIGHGKSTLADRIMEQTKTIISRDSSSQLLDNMSVEQQNGATIKAQTVTNHFISTYGHQYVLKSIDTPGTCQLYLRGV